jgi:hypothetical protein
MAHRTSGAPAERRAGRTSSQVSDNGNRIPSGRRTRQGQVRAYPPPWRIPGGYVGRIYRCTRLGRSQGSCVAHGIAAPILDEAAWDRGGGVFTQPGVIERELDRMEQNDPTGAEAEAVEKAIAGIQRKSVNLTRALALFDDPEASAPVVAQIEALRTQERVLATERDQILGRRANWAAGRQRLANVKAWCRKVGARLDQMTYDQKRTALDALGVHVRVWKANHDPRYLIMAGVPLDPPGQTGQDSSLYAASQNIHS